MRGLRVVRLRQPRLEARTTKRRDDRTTRIAPHAVVAAHDASAAIAPEGSTTPRRRLRLRDLSAGSIVQTSIRKTRFATPAGPKPALI
jgi:hypothetical protein